MALNDPRTIPYAFRVVEIDGIVWLYDDSERTYICSAVPCIFAEPLYAVNDEEMELPRGDYWVANDIERRESFPVPIDPEFSGPQVPYKDAWDAAVEAANANHII
ncbi:MAG: hypothetical protein EBT03_11910 [Betaproteobacteria bacterium]|nr:hypothetical protein [Betaproteobacteria bacterium]NCA18122.1 hypothetical protein [Betaproteobacteria bacterium]